MPAAHAWLHWYMKRKCRKFHIRRDGYSQYGQDVAVFDLLGRPSTGVFVDIGANDGRSLSNSLLFEEQGWTGICVEPHPIVFETLKANRRAHLVNACIAEKDGTVDFLLIEGGANMLSGIAEFISESHMQRIDTEIAQSGGNKRVVEIEALSPETLCRRFDIQTIDYLSIDAEGAEYSILKAFDFETIKIRIIGAENGTRSPVLYNYLTKKGFRLVKCVGCDEIYRNKTVD